MSYEPIDLRSIRPQPIGKRRNKVGLEEFGTLPQGDSFREFWNGLPAILAGRDIRQVVRAIIAAKKKKKPIVWLCGAHVIKVGCSPFLIDLMERGYVSALGLNGAGAIHDVEIAMIGGTSEDVAAQIRGGAFGMSEETSDFLNGAIRRRVRKGDGIGEALGKEIEARKLPHRESSLLFAAHRNRIPVTIHVSIGADIIHMHPNFDAAAVGEGSHRDFLIMANVIKDVGGGGVILNVGSSVMLPLIIEKSVAIARNLGHSMRAFTGVNLDFIRHYRANLNPVSRAIEGGGEGISIVGHHELTLPLIYWGLKAESGNQQPAQTKKRQR